MTCRAKPVTLKAPSCVIQGLGIRTTKLTPNAVKAVPAKVKPVMGSPNKSQASKAVQGGTKYMRLDTLVAAPR